METLRTFIALDMPPALRENLAHLQSRMSASLAGIRWVRPEAVHLTLKFLGSVREDRVGDVCAALHEAAAGIPGFSMSVRGLGAFPNIRNAKVVWVGIDEHKTLLQLHGALEQSLEQRGFSREARPFSPHLTLGRVKDARIRRDLHRFLAEHGDETLGTHDIDRISYIRSELYPTGPEYTCIEGIALATST